MTAPRDDHRGFDENSPVREYSRAIPGSSKPSLQPLDAVNLLLNLFREFFNEVAHLEKNIFPVLPRQWEIRLVGSNGTTAFFLFQIVKFLLLLEAEKFVDSGLHASVRDSGDIVVVLLRLHEARSASATRFHDSVAIAAVAIHKSNLVRSIANSMSAAKRIERDVIRLIMQGQIQEICRTQPEFS